jgi:hypothetical protein
MTRRQFRFQPSECRDPSAFHFVNPRSSINNKHNLGRLDGLLTNIMLVLALSDYLLTQASWLSLHINKPELTRQSRSVTCQQLLPSLYR